jgi:hypothetical protein
MTYLKRRKPKSVESGKRYYRGSTTACMNFEKRHRVNGDISIGSGAVGPFGLTALFFIFAERGEKRWIPSGVYPRESGDGDDQLRIAREGDF